MDLARRQTIQSLLRKHNLRPSKRLGQNFLINKSVLQKIIKAADLSEKDIVVEIGPGPGTLTIELAKRVKEVIAIEKDQKMCEILKKILKDYKNVGIVNQDILDSKFKIPRPRSAKRGGQNSKFKIVANLPYYIVSPVIRKFLEAKHKPKLMVLMVQKEVAQRIVAKPPHMNLLAVAVQFYVHPVRNKISNGAGPKIISYVSKKSFWPQPKVDSAIIKIVPQPVPKIDTKKFFNLVKTGFSSKRKMLKNNLKIEESVLKNIGLNPKIRAENLSVEDWIKLYDEIHSPH